MQVSLGQQFASRQISISKTSKEACEGRDHRAQTPCETSAICEQLQEKRSRTRLWPGVRDASFLGDPE